MTGDTEPILDPTGSDDLAVDTTLAPRPGTLRDTTVALLNNGKPNAAAVLSAFGDLLQAGYGVGAIRTYDKSYFGTPVEPAQVEEIAARCDVAVAAMGD